MMFEGPRFEISALDGVNLWLLDFLLGPLRSDPTARSGLRASKSLVLPYATLHTVYMLFRPRLELQLSRRSVRRRRP